MGIYREAHLESSRIKLATDVCYAVTAMTVPSVPRLILYRTASSWRVFVFLSRNMTLMSSLPALICPGPVWTFFFFFLTREACTSHAHTSRREAIMFNPVCIVEEAEKSGPSLGIDVEYGLSEEPDENLTQENLFFFLSHLAACPFHQKAC